MMKKFGIVSMAMSALMMMADPAYGQSLKDILNSDAVKNAVTAVTGGKKLSVENLQGTWTYVNPALQLKSDNALKKVTGSVAATEAEKKMKEYCAKVGIVEGIFNYTFNADSTFTSQLKKGSLKGSYTFDVEAKTITFNYSLLGKSKKATSGLTSLTAQVVLQSDRLTLLFNADKLLKFLSTVSTLTGSSSLQAVNKLAEQYDGMLMGFDLKK